MLKQRVFIVILLLCTVSFLSGDPAEVKLSRGFKYWRGEFEESPGPFLCIEPAVKDVTVVCDRWPDCSDLRQFGLDAIRLSGAETETEKCLAVFRWLRRVILNSDAPYEQFAWDHCWDDYFKFLNVYGTHYCSGMGRSLEMFWRALGYPGAKVYTGHTLADLYFIDYDDVGRWHHFDVNRGRYMFDRSGKRLLSTDDLTLDTNFNRSGAVHRYQGAWSRHRVELSLRAGERLERIWGVDGPLYQKLIWPEKKNKGRSVYNWFKQSELGPYKPTHGTGRWTYSPDFSDPAWIKHLAKPPVNMTVSDHTLIPTTAGTPAALAYHFRTPYIVSNAEVDLIFVRKTGADSIRLYLSVDNGKTWKPVWKCPEDTVGKNKLTAHICKKFSRKDEVPMDFNSPFGRYSFRVKLELIADKNPMDCRVENITFRTDVQQNKFALPQLQPGRNNITVRGKLAKNAALKITYVWDDPKGRGRRNVTVIEKTPHTYEIIAAGRKWEDCVCRSLIVEALSADGKGNRTVVKETPSTIHALPPLPSVHETCGHWSLSKRVKPVKLRPLEEVLKQLGVNTGYRTLMSDVIPQLIEHADPSAWKPVKEFLYTYKGKSKARKAALIALYTMDPERTRIKGILRDFAGNPDLCSGCDANSAIMIKANRWTEFVPFLVDLLKTGKGWAPPIMKAFAVVGDERTASVVKPCLNSSKTRILNSAALAAGRTGDRSLIPRLRKLMRKKLRRIENRLPSKINAVVSLGRLKDTESIPEIRKFLAYVPRELWRAKAARALAYMGDKSSIPAIRAALAVEPVEWVRDAMKESIEMLEQGRIVIPRLGGEAWNHY